MEKFGLKWNGCVLKSSHQPFKIFYICKQNSISLRLNVSIVRINALTIENEIKFIYFNITILSTMSDEDIMFADWDKIILKNARSRDSKELGNVIAVDDENIILNQDNIEFKIPKSYVEGYRGNAVFLGLNGKDIQYYQF